MSERSPFDVPDVLRSGRDERGRFVLPWRLDDTPSRGPRDILRWVMERRRNGIAPNPPRAAFPIATPQIAAPRNGTDELRMTWVGHATFLIQLAGINILTDPVWSHRASPIGWAGPGRLVPPALSFDSLPPIDVVILSHDHYDHLDSRTVRRLHVRFGDDVSWVAPLGHGEWLRGRGIRNITELDWWETTSVSTPAGTLEVRATPAQHWTKRSPMSERTRLWASFVLAAERGAPVYFGGDSGYFEGYDTIGRLGPFAAVLLPIGAYDPRWFMKPAHMNPEEAVRAWIDLGATGTFVGMHWGTFRLTDEPPLEPPARTAAAWREHMLPETALWLPRHGETRIIPLT